MPRGRCKFFASVAIIVAACAMPTPARQLTDPIETGDIAINLQPFYQVQAEPTTFAQDLVSAFDGSGRLFMTMRDGRIEMLHSDGTLGAQPFLDFASAGIEMYNDPFGEGGFSGLAFSPHYQTDGKFYTFQTEKRAIENPPRIDFTHPELGPNGGRNFITIREWTVSGDPNLANSTSRVLMRIDHPQENHQGGGLRFDRDGLLYISLGDGGSGNDQGTGHTDQIGNAQDMSVVFGKILRIDPFGKNSANGEYGIPANNPFVGQQGKLPEIYAYGFRNPYRISFDRETRKLFTGDVGQFDREEVDEVISGGNYGWVFREGTQDNTNFPFPPPPNFSSIDPIGEYTHFDGHAIIGGFIYRGSMLPQLQGKYIFGDLGGADVGGNDPARLFYMDGAGGVIHEFQYDLSNGGIAPPGPLVSFGEDDAGELYAVFADMTVARIIPEPAATGGILAAMWVGAISRRRSPATRAVS